MPASPCSWGSLRFKPPSSRAESLQQCMGTCPARRRQNPTVNTLSRLRATREIFSCLCWHGREAQEELHVCAVLLRLHNSSWYV